MRFLLTFSIYMCDHDGYKGDDANSEHAMNNNFKTFFRKNSSNGD